MKKINEELIPVIEKHGSPVQIKKAHELREAIRIEEHLERQFTKGDGFVDINDMRNSLDDMRQEFPGKGHVFDMVEENINGWQKKLEDDIATDGASGLSKYSVPQKIANQEYVKNKDYGKWKEATEKNLVNSGLNPEPVSLYTSPSPRDS